MSNALLGTAVRASFLFTSRRKALRKTEALMQEYIKLSDRLPEDAGRRCVEVPWMPGVDEDMRKWSFFMILEHNAIVNRAITATTVQLARGEALRGAARIDPKNDVMPSASAGNSQLGMFVASVRGHLAAVEALPTLRGTATAPHPIFGPLDAHQWNCLFAFHLGLHLRQARFVAARAAGSQFPSQV